MDFYDVITRRKSLRNYDPSRPVDPEVLNRILDAGRIAPTAANHQPFRIILVSSQAMLEKIRPCYSRSWLAGAPHILIVIGNRQQAWVRKHDGNNYVETDVTIVMDHMILAAENEGVNTCWIAAFNPDMLRKALELEEYEEVFSITPLGYQNEGYIKKNITPRKSFAEVVQIM